MYRGRCNDHQVRTGTNKPGTSARHPLWVMIWSGLSGDRQIVRIKSRIVNTSKLNNTWKNLDFKPNFGHLFDNPIEPIWDKVVGSQKGVFDGIDTSQQDTALYVFGIRLSRCVDGI